MCIKIFLPLLRVIVLVTLPWFSSLIIFASSILSFPSSYFFLSVFSIKSKSVIVSPKFILPQPTFRFVSVIFALNHVQSFNQFSFFFFFPLIVSLLSSPLLRCPFFFLFFFFFYAPASVFFKEFMSILYYTFFLFFSFFFDMTAFDQFFPHSKNFMHISIFFFWGGGKLSLSSITLHNTHHSSGHSSTFVSSVSL